MNPLDEWKKTRHTLIHRLLGAYLIFALWLLGLTGRLIYLQVYKSEEYRLKAVQQQAGFIELSPKRGDIVDRHLDPLAISVTIDSIFTHPRKVNEPLATARTLAPILQQKEQQLYEKLLSKERFVYLARKVPPRQAERIRKLDLAGVYFQEETKRVYPGRELAAHVLGFVGLDNEGLSGLEYLYNDFIKGERTRVNLRFDAKRHSYYSDTSVVQTQGNILVLNIDSTIQYIAQQALEEAVTSSRALNGTAIVMDPRTGEVLAMASYPSFNPNRYADFTSDARRNRSILDIYEPGSTFKVVTFSAVMNEGLAEPWEAIDCRVGTLRIAGKVYREAKRSFGLLPLTGVLAKSSNVGTIKLGLRLGKEKLYEYIRRLGFGQKTHIDLPGEQAGLLRPPSQWSRISIGAISIGQELGATPLQVLRATSTIANGGLLTAPMIVRRVLTPEGEVLYEPKPESRQVLSRRTVSQMKEAMSQVVLEGTGKSAKLEGYSSGGKTGTAQKFVDGRYSMVSYVASYVGFAPLHESSLCAIVVIDEPKNHYYGGQVAGPAFKQIMERSLIHLRIPQDQPVETRQFAQTVTSLEPAVSDGISVVERELPLQTLEETILTLIQEESAGGEHRSSITVNTNTFSLPDFSGLSLREVARQCAKLGLRLKAVGDGMAVGQRPAAGSEVSKDTVCEIFFSNEARYASSRLAIGSERQVARRDRGNEP